MRIGAATAGDAISEAEDCPRDGMRFMELADEQRVRDNDREGGGGGRREREERWGDCCSVVGRGGGGKGGGGSSTRRFQRNSKGCYTGSKMQCLAAETARGELRQAGGGCCGEKERKREREGERCA